MQRCAASRSRPFRRPAMRRFSTLLRGRSRERRNGTKKRPVRRQSRLIRHFQDDAMKKPDASQDQSASKLISKRIADLGDWRGETLARMRKLIREAVPGVIEEWKWRGTPVWSRDGIICTGESYKQVVKFTFAKGASLKDPTRLFNASLDGNVRRAIDIHEGEKVGGSAFKALVREAVALNRSGKSKPPKKAQS